MYKTQTGGGGAMGGAASRSLVTRDKVEGGGSAVARGRRHAGSGCGLHGSLLRGGRLTGRERGRSSVRRI